MGSLSKLSEKCKKCPNVDECNHKKMELCAYIEPTNISANISKNAPQSLAMPLLRETMTINDGRGNMVNVYKDDIAKQINKNLSINGCLNYGA